MKMLYPAILAHYECAHKKGTVSEKDLQQIFICCLLVNSRTQQFRLRDRKKDIILVGVMNVHKIYNFI